MMGEVPEKCVIVVAEGLPPGLAANAAAVIALTLGATVRGLVGSPFVDADGGEHPGLIPQGLPVLTAPGSALGELRARAEAASLGIVDFPAAGQETNDYDEFRRRVATTPADELEYLGVALYGPRRAVGRLTGRFPLLR
jgi:hypothetical protein